MMCLRVVLFGPNLFGTLCASWTCMSSSFTKLGKFSFIIFSNKFLIFWSSSSPSGTPMIQMLVWGCTRGFLFYPCFFFNSFSFLLIWLNAFFFLMFQIIDLILSSSPPLLVPHRFFFISLNVTFISAWVFFMLILSCHTQ